VILQANSGVAASRNAGASAAIGEYLAFLDADDLWLPHHVERSVAALDANRAAVLCCSGYIPVARGKRLPPAYVKCAPSLPEMLQGGWSMLPSTIVMRAESFDKCGGFSTEFRRTGSGFEDTYMWLRMREQGEFHYLREADVIYNTVAFSDLGAKYAKAFPVFVRLVRSRYGKSADPGILAAKDSMAASLLTKAIEQMDGKAPTDAVRTLMGLAYFHPGYLLKNGNFKRLWRRRNLRRCRALLTSSVFGSDKQG
jgi:glycosyltransferase involved in cell wall biosynthesis